MVHIDNGTLLSHEKERNCAICRDVDMETHMGEVSQKEKNKYCILMHIVESRKMVETNLFAKQK